MNSSTGRLLSDLVDLTDLIEKDQNRDLHTLLNRDHEFGQNLDDTGKKPIRDIRSWIEFRRGKYTAADGAALNDNSDTNANDRQTVSTGQQFSASRALLSTAITITGLLIGWFAALALLHYDGTRAVNIMWLILVFVVAQLALVTVFLITLLPGAITKRIPGLRALSSSIEAASPGNVLIVLLRLLPQRHRETINRIMGSGRRHSHRFSSVVRWLVLFWSQLFALAFIIGAIACSFMLIVFTDLAFGWGTTLLDSGGKGFFKLVSSLSLPWSTLVESAVPSQDLIDSTRIYLNNTAPQQTQAQVASVTSRESWWPFLMMCMLVYGLLPRFVTSYLANRRLKSEIADTMLSQPGVSEVLDRMTARRVATQAPTPEAPTHQLDHHELASADETLLAGSAVVVNWSNVPLSEDALIEYVQQILLTNVHSHHIAGGTRSIDDDLQLIASLSTMQEIPTIVIVVKSWETPMLEFLDFLGDLREAIGANPPIIVLAVAANDNETLSADPQHLQIWSERLQTIGDPQLRFGAPGS